MTTVQDLMQTTYVSVDVKDTVSKLLGGLRKAREHYALVFDGSEYLGVLGKRFLLTSRIDPSHMKVGNIIKKRSKAKTPFFVPTLTPDMDLKKISKLLASADVHLLPVLKNKKVIGVVHAEDVVQEIANEYKKLSCSEFARSPICARINDDVASAINLFSRHGIDHLPVVDDQNRLAGMLSTGDLIENPSWAMTSQKVPKSTRSRHDKRSGFGSSEKTKMAMLPIKNCLSDKPICCTSPETKVSAALKLMKEHHVSSIVLVKYDKPVGIFTIKDILIDYAK